MAKKKRALIVEGGGMRGAHSAGVLAELARHSLPPFDVVIGSSAGACTVAFWVAEQYSTFERVWANYLHDDRLIRYRHIFLPGPIMDLKYLLFEVFVRHEPLDTEKILASPIDFFITATHCETGEAQFLHNKDSIDVLKALYAGAAIPLAHPLPVWHEGVPLADGGISASVPIQKAIKEGCDELWVILTRPRGYRKRPPSKLPWPRWIYRRYPALAEALANRHRAYNDSLEQLEALESQNRAFVIYPGEDLAVSRFTRSRKKILAAIEMGRRDAAKYLAGIDLAGPIP